MIAYAACRLFLQSLIERLHFVDDIFFAVSSHTIDAAAAAYADDMSRHYAAERHFDADTRSHYYYLLLATSPLLCCFFILYAGEMRYFHDTLFPPFFMLRYDFTRIAECRFTSHTHDMPRYRERCAIADENRAPPLIR